MLDEKKIETHQETEYLIIKRCAEITNKYGLSFSRFGVTMHSFETKGNNIKVYWKDNVSLSHHNLLEVPIKDFVGDWESWVDEKIRSEKIEKLKSEQREENLKKKKELEELERLQKKYSKT
jgi:hypothetical protein